MKQPQRLRSCGSSRLDIPIGAGQSWYLESAWKLHLPVKSGRLLNVSAQARNNKVGEPQTGSSDSKPELGVSHACIDAIADFDLNVMQRLL